MLSEQERKDRLAYWIRDTMNRRGLTPPKIADRVGVSRSAVNAWVSGKSVPSMIYLGPLAATLQVDSRLFADLPPVPPSGAAEYLVESGESGLQEGMRRGRAHPAPEGPSKPARSRKRQPRGDGAGLA